MQANMADDLPYRNAPAKFEYKVWTHFSFAKNNGQTVICKHRMTELKYVGGTTNMSTHFSRHHNITEIGSKSGMPETLI